MYLTLKATYGFNQNMVKSTPESQFQGANIAQLMEKLISYPDSWLLKLFKSKT